MKIKYKWYAPSEELQNKRYIVIDDTDKWWIVEQTSNTYYIALSKKDWIPVTPEKRPLYILEIKGVGGVGWEDMRNKINELIRTINILTNKEE